MHLSQVVLIAALASAGILAPAAGLAADEGSPAVFSAVGAEEGACGSEPCPPDDPSGEGACGSKPCPPDDPSGEGACGSKPCRSDDPSGEGACGSKPCPPDDPSGEGACGSKPCPADDQTSEVANEGSNYGEDPPGDGSAEDTSTSGRASTENDDRSSYGAPEDGRPENSAADDQDILTGTVRGIPVPAIAASAAVLLALLVTFRVRRRRTMDSSH